MQNMWLTTKLKNIAFKEETHKVNGGSLRAKTHFAVTKHAKHYI